MQAAGRRTGQAGEHLRLSQPLNTRTLSVSSLIAWTLSLLLLPIPTLQANRSYPHSSYPLPLPLCPPMAPLSLLRTSHPHLPSAVSPSLAQPGEAGREEFPGRKGLSHSATHLVSDLDTQLEGVGRKRLLPHKFSWPVHLLPTGRGRLGKESPSFINDQNLLGCFTQSRGGPLLF